jgi:hypothetical protein
VLWRQAHARQQVTQSQQHHLPGTPTFLLFGEWVLEHAIVWLWCAHGMAALSARGVDSSPHKHVGSSRCVTYELSAPNVPAQPLLLLVCTLFGAGV